MIGEWRRTLALAVVLGVAAAGCGGSDSASGDGGDGGGSADVVSAVLGIITTNIDTDTGDGFSDATEGEELVVGDKVRTDSTGFAEVTYHDGSWMRVESEATLTIEDLADSSAGQVVSTSIDTGEAWNRVAELSEPEDEYSVDTPVASAAVRGTAFSIDCDGDVACTFSVVEGEVLVTPDTGDPVTLTAGQTLTVTADEAPPAPEVPGVEALSEQPFIAKNLELDEEKAAETDGGDEGQGGGGQDEGAAGDEIDLAGVDACALLPEGSLVTLTGVVTPFTTDGGSSDASSASCFWGSREPAYVELTVSRGDTPGGGVCPTEPIQNMASGEAVGGTCTSSSQTKVYASVADRGVVVDLVVNEPEVPIGPADLTFDIEAVLGAL